MLSRPLQRTFAPSIVVAHNEDRYEDKHLNERKLRKREVVTHEDYRPRKQKDRFDVENQKEHGYDVVTNSEAIMSFSSRVDAALIGSHLAFFVLNRP